MWERYALIGIAFSIILILLDFYLLRKHKINGRGFVLWFITGAVIGLLSTVSPIVSFISVVFGTEFTISAFVAAGFLFFVFLIFYLYYKVSELHDLMMKLTMKVTLAEYSEKQSDPSNLKAKKKKSKR